VGVAGHGGASDGSAIEIAGGGAVGALTLLPAQAALRPMADVELRMVSGQTDVGQLIYDQPPVVVKLDILAQNLETAGHPIAATLVARQARFLYG